MMLVWGMVTITMRGSAFAQWFIWAPEDAVLTPEIADRVWKLELIWQQFMNAGSNRS